jgi:NAD(P)-dependent dehydrogenase (short-subunit alcohol dehydrogenase family)
MKLFEDKIVVVTGSSRGLGKTIAKRFFSEGAKLGVCGAKSDYRDEVLKDIAGDDESRIFGMCMDLTDLKQINSFFDGVVEHFGRIDILINNAGVHLPVPSLEETEEKWDLTLDLNVKSYFFASQYYIKHVIGRNAPGVIVNTASINAEYIVDGCVSYCVSKSGVVTLTKCLAKEFGKQGIRVNAVGPGSFPSDMNKDVYTDPANMKALEDKLPLGRQGSQDEIADAVLFLASDRASYITGHTLYVDGGFLLAN